MKSSRYEEIADELIKRIRNGTYVGKIPSQRSLVVEFEASNRTIDRAFEILKYDGLIRTSPEGTFINRK